MLDYEDQETKTKEGKNHTMPATKKLMRAITTFHGPDYLVVEEGDLFAADDPIVKKYRNMFHPADEAVRRPVEAAVSRPGG